MNPSLSKHHIQYLPSRSALPLSILIIDILFVQLIRRFLDLRRRLRNTSFGLRRSRASTFLPRIVHSGRDVLGHGVLVDGGVAVGGFF